MHLRPSFGIKVPATLHYTDEADGAFSPRALVFGNSPNQGHHDADDYGCHHPYEMRLSEAGSAAPVEDRCNHRDREDRADVVEHKSKPGRRGHLVGNEVQPGISRSRTREPVADPRDTSRDRQPPVRPDPSGAERHHHHSGRGGGVTDEHR
jgi:hypothetical protein